MLDRNVQSDYANAPLDEAVNHQRFWRGVRVAEGARLESVCAACRTAGSNPALSVGFYK